MIRRHGFTLLEVLVAVLVLALALTAIFASEAGATRMGARARFTTTATLLARCKMAEIEEELMNEGLPAVFANGVDECCEEGEVEGFECEWEIERVTLPDLIPAETPEGEEGTPPPEGSGTPTTDQLMSGAALGAGADDMITQFALQYGLPVLRPHIEEQTRRVTVTVRWHEGTAEQSFDVVQYVVAQQAPALLMNAAADEAINGAPGAPPAAPATGSGGTGATGGGRAP